MASAGGHLVVGGMTMGNTVLKDKDLEMMNIGPLKNAIDHAVCRWCYQNIPLEEFSEKVRQIGIKGIDLLKPEEWEVVIKHNLECSLATDTFVSIENGFNNTKNHNGLISNYEALIMKAADFGIDKVIVFSGNRDGMTDQVGLENCANGLKGLVKHAEKAGVTLVMELLNSKLDHRGYQCDNTQWGVSLVDKIGSPNFKLLYDIYHMQIMEGDIISTIKEYHPYFAHYHTGGVPGRNEINDSQELNYKAIVQAIAGTGFKGYIAQEFIPTYDDQLMSLKEGVQICNVQL